MQDTTATVPATPTAQESSALASLRKIVDWDGKSQGIHRALTAAFRARDYEDCIADLNGRGIEPQSYINALDKIIDVLPADSERRRRSVRALSQTCGLYGILPTSYTITSIAKPGQRERPYESVGFSEIWKLTDKTNHELVFGVRVVRVYIPDPTESINREYCKEMVFLKHAKHPNVLSIEGVAPGLFEFSMVSQWMSNGNMQEYVEQHEGVNRLELLIGVTRGLSYMHDNELVHGDLRSTNILIDATGSPRLSHFSLHSTMMALDREVDPRFDTAARYRAPELPRPETIPTMKSDVYSLSMVIVELATGKVPFPDNIHVIAASLASEGKRPPKPRHFDGTGMSSAVWKVAKKCWDHKEEERPEANEVLQSLEKIASAGEERTQSPSRRMLRGLFK